MPTTVSSANCAICAFPSSPDLASRWRAMSDCHATMLVPRLLSRDSGWTAPEQVARTIESSVSCTRTYPYATSVPARSKAP